MNDPNPTVDRTNIIEYKTDNMVNSKPGIEQYTTLDLKQSTKLLGVMSDGTLKCKVHIQ